MASILSMVRKAFLVLRLQENLLLPYGIYSFIQFKSLIYLEFVLEYDKIYTDYFDFFPNE